MCLSIVVLLRSAQYRSSCIYMAAEREQDQKIERIFLTFQEAQQFFAVSHQTLYNLMRQGLPSHKIGKKRVFLKDELVRWIKEH